MGRGLVLLILLINFVVLINIPHVSAPETLYCRIYYPSGGLAREVPNTYGCSGTQNVQCSINCVPTDSQCCSMEGQYTWRVELTQVGNGWCGSGSQGPGNAHFVEWDSQTWCTLACTGASVVWEPLVGQCCGDQSTDPAIDPDLDSDDDPDWGPTSCSGCPLGLNQGGSRVWEPLVGQCCGDDAGDDPDWGQTSCLGCPLGLNQGLREWDIGGEVSPDACCGDDSSEHARDCQDNDEGFCSLSSDNRACCSQSSDCVFSNNCYAWQEQVVEWNCGALELGVWHDAVPPWADIVINNGSPYTITRDVVLNLNMSDNGTGVSEYLVENDDGYFESYPNLGTYPEGSVAYYKLDSIQAGQVSDESGNGNHGLVYGNTKLLMHFDEGSGNSVYDETSYNNDGTLQGDLGSTGWSSGGDCQSGSCLEFDGTNDYVSVPDSGDWYFGSDDFSISFWARWNGVPGATGLIGQSMGGGSTLKWGVYWNAITANQLTWHMHNPAGSAHNINWAWAPVGNTWYHIAVVRDGNSWYLFVNNAQIGVAQTESTAVPDVSSDLRIGSDGEAWRYFKGTMDEVAIYSKALSQEEIETMYNDGRADFTEIVPGKIGGAMEFDGDDDNVIIGDDASLDISIGITLAGWVWFDSVAQNQQTIAAKRGSVANPSGNYALRTGSGANTDELEFYYRDGSGWHVYTTSGANLLAGGWYHVAASYTYGNGASIRIYLNGSSLSGSWTAGNGNAPVNTNDQPVTIGGLTNDEFLDGKIDELLIYDRVLTPGEIETFYRGPKGGLEREMNWRLSSGDGVKTVYLSVKDHVGNTRRVSDTIILDTQDPINWIDPPLPKYTGPKSKHWAGSADGSVKAFNVSWKAYDVSGVNCYQVQYNTSTLPWTNWSIGGLGCTDLLDLINKVWGSTCGDIDYDYHADIASAGPVEGPDCSIDVWDVTLLSDHWGDEGWCSEKMEGLGTNCTPRTEWVFGPVVAPEDPLQLQNGETYSFRVRTLDNVGRLGDWSQFNSTTLDTLSPELDVTAVDQDGNNLIGVGVISHEDVESVTVTSSAMDSISGIGLNYIYYCRVYGGVEDCRTEYCSPSDPGTVSSCSVTIEYGENMVIKFRAVAEDYAGNINATPGLNLYFFVTNHALVNFVAHYLDVMIGEGAVLKAQVRNLQNRFDNITLNLSGYDFIYFAGTGGIELGPDKRTAWVGLNPYEERELFVKVLSSSIGQFFVYLNATSLLTDDGEPCSGPDCVTDSDTASVTMGYPLEFPGINIWGVALLVLASLAVYFRIENRGPNS